MLVIIEMPSGTRLKYETAKNYDHIWIDRVLSVPCPHSYGYLPGTLSGDGDPTDAFVVASEPIAHQARLEFDPHFLIEMQDGGLEDNKYVGCIKGDEPPTMREVREIIDYLQSYKKGVILGKVINLKETSNG